MFMFISFDLHINKKSVIGCDNPVSGLQTTWLLMCSYFLRIQCAIYRQNWEGVFQSVFLLVMLHLRICVTDIDEMWSKGSALGCWGNLVRALDSLIKVSTWQEAQPSLHWLYYRRIFIRKLSTKGQHFTYISLISTSFIWIKFNNNNNHNNKFSFISTLV
jgi:hypothetical protein